MANEKETPPAELLEYARKAFDMPKAGAVALLRKCAAVLKTKVADYPYNNSRLILTAVKQYQEST